MNTSKDSKAVQLEHEHLRWLIQARADNQQSGFRLLTLLDKHTTTIKKHKVYAVRAQLLVAVCFSLWRAAFLADKTGLREAVFKDAREFLAKMLKHNAIAYAQDRDSREWTFNYYMNAAKDSLLVLDRAWPAIGRKLNAQNKVLKGTTVARRRWDRHQKAFETAVESFQSAVESLPR
jgi:hypothetical protein